MTGSHVDAIYSTAFFIHKGCGMRRITMVAVFGIAALSSSLSFAHSVHSDHDAHGAAADPALFAGAKTVQGLTLTNCWVRLLPAHLPSAGYLVLHNQTDQAFTVLAARSPHYANVMIHETIELNGMSRMQMVEHTQVASKASLVFEPGGLHLMFSQPTGQLQVGQQMELELLLEGAQKITANCKVNEAKAQQFD